MVYNFHQSFVFTSVLLLNFIFFHSTHDVEGEKLLELFLDACVDFIVWVLTNLISFLSLHFLKLQYKFLYPLGHILPLHLFGLLYDVIQLICKPLEQKFCQFIIFFNFFGFVPLKNVLNSYLQFLGWLRLKFGCKAFGKKQFFKVKRTQVSRN